MAKPDRSWLRAEHPVYSRWKTIWARLERLARGGMYVRDELRPFDWESLPNERLLGTGPVAVQMRSDGVGSSVPHGQRMGSGNRGRPGEHYRRRQQEAVYHNFPELFASEVVGQIFRKAPGPDDDLLFGEDMGTVKREDGVLEPSEAELIYYNVDGVGLDGSQWESYWARSAMRAIYTGHRWHIVEAPGEPARTRADVIVGTRRPYMIELSPLRVTNWEYDRGVLQFATILGQTGRMHRDEESGLPVRTTVPDVILYVRRGYTALDEDVRDEGALTFSGGGWWKFDGEKLEAIEGQTGTWERTDGEIPMFPLYYKRDEGAEGLSDLTDAENVARTAAEEGARIPAMSYPGIMDIGNAAVAYMNLTSALHYEIWDSCAGIEWLRGVDPGGWTLAIDKILSGERLVPLVNQQKPETSTDVTRSSANPAVDAIVSRLQELRIEVSELMAQEQSAAPEASGISKAMSFAAGKAPRLSMFAAEIENSQNMALYFLHRRLGHPRGREGVTQWPRDYELIDFSAKVTEFLEHQRTSGAVSPTLTARALISSARQANLIRDEDDVKALEEEFRSAIEDAQAREEALRTLLAGTQDVNPQPPRADNSPTPQPPTESEVRPEQPAVPTAA